jgi:tRNA A37 methylthiotransferase MiaB
MNRQYSRDDFLRMIDSVRDAFDRPALTTDVITGFPGETDAEFQQTLDVVDRAAFIHVHAFPFSPRPGTAAARWKRDFIPAHVAQQRVAALTDRARHHSRHFRRQFISQVVEVLVERFEGESPHRHGRCERYFDVAFEDSAALPGDAVNLRIINVSDDQTSGERLP